MPTRHKPMLSADAEGTISLWCICDEENAISTYVGDWVASSSLEDDFDEHLREAD